jgi:nucleotide-binding universal stress UspA family protein
MGDASLAGMGTLRRYRIVIALDGSQYAEIVLEHAFDQAARHGDADLHLITIVDDPADIDHTKRWLARATLEGLDAFSERRSQWRTRLHVRVGKTADEIANLAAEVAADLLVIGNYGVHPQRKPIAMEVIERAPCATLIVGLTGRVVEAVEQCPDCVLVREESDGERWFCEAHTSDHELRLSTLVPSSLSLSHSNLW